MRLRSLPTPACLAALLAAALPTHATENGQVRALLGAPSYELATPQFPGLYGQLWLQHYRARRLRGDDGLAPSSRADTPLGPLALQAQGRVEAQVLVPRVTWVTEQLVADGRLGFSATLPVVHQKTTVRLGATLPPGLTPAQQAAVEGLLAQESARRSGEMTGLADAEVAGFVDWQQDESRLVAGLALGLPTGDYQAGRALNTGAGKYWTLRPLLVASRVWENGLELGLRATYSFNTRNTDTEVRSGQYLHADWSAMWRANDLWRLGLQGYVLAQTTKDRGPGVHEHGNQVRALAAGPVLAYLSESGNWALDVKWLREFSVRNRPEGQLAWVRLNLRLD